MEQGVRGVRRVLGYSKKDLLLFSKLHIMGLERQLTETAIDPGLRADYEYLASTGYLSETLETPQQMVDYVEDNEDIAEAIRKQEPSAIIGIYPVGHPWGYSRVLPPGGELAVAHLLGMADSRFVPILNVLPDARDWKHLSVALHMGNARIDPQPRHRIVELVLKALPLPGDDVPLEAVLDFSNDDETRRKLAGLDIWIRRAAQSGRELQDIALEMEESLHDFSNHMRLADMRSQTSGLRMVMSVPLGIIEELLHLKPKRAMDIVFDYRDRKANRLEAELSAPGGALAYIYEAEKRFGS